MQLRGMARWVLVWSVLMAAAGWALGGDAPAKEADAPKKADEPRRREPEGGDEDVVARVDKVTITRADLAQVRRQIQAANPNAIVPPNKELVEQLIERVLWERYFDQQGLRATGPEIQREIQRIDLELRQRGSTYQRQIAAMGITPEEHASMLAFQVSLGRLRDRAVGEIKEEEIKKEFEAHPEWYDGSRVRVYRIFVETASISHDPEKLKKAKERIDKVYAELQAGKDFGKLAADYDEGGTGRRNGELGWFTRKGTEEDEALLAAAWNLKVGEYTKPIEGSRGWYILKVTDREPARLTPFGARGNVIAELVRRKLQATLEELKAKAVIERRI